MFRLPAVVLLSTAVIISVGCGDKPQSKQRPISSMFEKQGEVTITKSDGTLITTVDVEIADKPQTRETGLMGRPALGEKNGMLFVFEDVQPLSFWMMNTMIPLDMLFIDEDGTINTIQRDTVPFSQDTYASDRPGKYVLEVNAGFCARFGIMPGDRIEWKRTAEN